MAQNHEQPSGQERQSGEVLVRPFQDSDLSSIVHLIQTNTRKSFSLFPKDVVNAYLQANHTDDLRHAIKSEGTEAFVATGSDSQINGFVLIRHNSIPRRNAYGDLDLRRLHVSPDAQGQGVGQKLLRFIGERARSPEINVQYITTHASGSSRPFFERDKWTGRTVLNEMDKRGTSAIVFVAQKRISPPEIKIYQKPTHVIYAGSNQQRENFLKKTIKDSDERIEVVSTLGDEDPSEDVVKAAKSKTLSVASRLATHSHTIPLVVASDVRVDLLRTDPESDRKYTLVNRGKPKNGDPLQEIKKNFELLRDTARQTEKPAPYILRSATYIHNPLNPADDSYAEYDVSIWLSQEALETLSTDEELQHYQSEVNERYNADVTNMSAGFALPIFLERDYVAGINGHPFETLPHRDEIVQKALHTALVGIHENAVKERLGLINA